MIATPETPVLSDADEARVFGTRGLYPWDVYFDGKARWLTQAEHFPNLKSLRVMIDYIRLMARRHKVKVKIRRDTAKGGLHLKALTKKADVGNGKQDMEAGRTQTGRSVRDSTKGTQRRKRK